MGRGKRHSKNAGVMGSEALTYHERRAMGHGSLTERLGKDSQGHFYDCCLTLRPAKDPVMTPQGFLFSREAILEYFLTQKKEKKRQLSEWEEHQNTQKRQKVEEDDVKRLADVAAFERQNVAAASDQTVDAVKQGARQAAAAKDDTESSQFSIKANAERVKADKSFWQAQATPDANTDIEKPSMEVLCPLSGKKLKIKDLITVTFTPVPEGVDGLYMDPISQDVLTDASSIVVLRPTGEVMLEKTYSTCIKPSGVHNGHKLSEKDVIRLKGGGTGFSGREGQKLQTKKSYVLGPGSGRADLRGQAAGGASRFGLSFQN